MPNDSMNYSAITTAIMRDIKAYEDRLPIFNEACRSRFFFHPRPTPRVCLFFHGFTAGPYQFVPMAEALFRAGYNVLMPLMPGQGVAGDWNKDNPPPLPTDPQTYLKFAVQWLKLSQYLGDRVVVAGLSGGGALAAWLAVEKAAMISRAVLFAPYLSSFSKVVDLFVQKFDNYFEWHSIKGPSYPGFQFSALRTFHSIGQYALNQSHQVQTAPMFVISSESDKAVNNTDHQVLFEAALKRQPKCWYHRFDRVLDIPHTMMTESEGNKYQNLLITMTRAFVESDLTWDEVEEIGYRMTKGKTFDAVVDELNLSNRVSSDMPAMMTMVDKWSIAVKRQMRAVRRSHER